MASTSAPITFTKLRSGDWGIRSTVEVVAGDSVEVAKRDGSKQTRTIARVLWHGDKDGQHIYLCALEEIAKPRGRRSRSRECIGCGETEHEQGATRCWECGAGL